MPPRRSGLKEAVRGEGKESGVGKEEGGRRWWRRRSLLRIVHGRRSDGWGNGAGPFNLEIESVTLQRLDGVDGTDAL